MAASDPVCHSGIGESNTVEYSSCLFDSDLNSDDLEIWLSYLPPNQRSSRVCSEPESSLDVACRRTVETTYISARPIALIVLLREGGLPFWRFFLWIPESPIEIPVFHRFHLLVLDPEPRPDDEIQNRAKNHDVEVHQAFPLSMS